MISVELHKLLQLARESEEDFINGIKYLSIETNIMNIINILDIIVLYDYDKAFTYILNLLNKGISLYWIARSILYDDATKCRYVFEKKYGYDILLSESIWSNNYKIAKHCLENGADPRTKTEGGNPIIFFARYKIFCLLLKYGIDPKDTNACHDTIFGDTFEFFNCGKFCDKKRKKENYKKTLKLLKSKYKITEYDLSWLKNSDIPEIKELVEQRLNKIKKIS